MIEMLVGGFILTGSVCIIDGEEQRSCRDVPAVTFGNQYVCNRRVESILDDFPYVKPEKIGFPQGERLSVTVRCNPVRARA